MTMLIMSICSKNVILKTVNQSPHNLGKISPKKRLYLRNHFYSPQSFEANLKTALFFFLSFFFLKTFCENQRFLVFLSLLGRAWACLYILYLFLYFVLYVWAPAFLVTFEAIFCSNNI